ncbi:ABC transporter substrate-binding protein [Pseudoclavibacter endophyticus]|uniref:ABC transporter substrate-binding protein n=1 Tax=Pseudoclavibacter endophyticus TaxID=1778590 RepID=A0A6H9WK07_9MICO|nr:ABC transporter substrate-binding protein [Pseudoclavibacter endophyticus]KAB1648059.1 ABC transporter substrate-binding protein [Pseudoclavibacter endophyticus]
MNRNARGALSAIAVVAAAALALTGCARGPAGDDGTSPGITDDSITLGITTPLSGNTAGQGVCSVAGLAAYFGAKNAEGGIAFGDGKTRTVEIEALDDTYDPQKAKANYDQLKDSVFAMTAGIGTPTNRSYLSAAIADEVPQVLLMSGDPIFNDREESPWQLGFVPTYINEGAAFGEQLAGSSDDHEVAVLYQNDDYGLGYLEGFKEAVADAANVEIVQEQSYESTDISVDAQVTEMAATGADVVLAAVPINPLMIGAMQKAQSLGWMPSWLLPSNTSSPSVILEPGGAENYPGVYSVAFAVPFDAPEYADDPEVQGFLANLEAHGDYADVPPFPHCAWSYMIAATLDQAFQDMGQPTRSSFMEALRSIDDFQAPLMLPGTSISTTEDGQPAVSSVVVQKYNGSGYDTVESWDEG